MVVVMDMAMATAAVVVIVTEEAVCDATSMLSSGFTVMKAYKAI